MCGNSTLQDVTIACGTDVLVNYGTSLTLVGDIHDWGAIVVGPPQFEGDPALIVKGDVTLDGSGSVVSNGADDSIVASCEGGTLRTTAASSALATSAMVAGAFDSSTSIAARSTRAGASRRCTVDTGLRSRLPMLARSGPTMAATSRSKALGQ